MTLEVPNFSYKQFSHTVFRTIITDSQSLLILKRLLIPKQGTITVSYIAEQAVPATAAAEEGLVSSLVNCALYLDWQLVLPTSGGQCNKW